MISHCLTCQNSVSERSFLDVDGPDQDPNRNPHPPYMGSGRLGLFGCKPLGHSYHISIHDLLMKPPISDDLKQLMVAWYFEEGLTYREIHCKQILIYHVDSHITPQK